jgi:hypothetical protein
LKYEAQAGFLLVAASSLPNPPQHVFPFVQRGGSSVLRAFHLSLNKLTTKLTTNRRVIMALKKIGAYTVALILTSATASFGNPTEAKSHLTAKVGDQVTVTTSDTTIPLPATIIAIVKNKYTVQMLPSYQYKGNEQFQISARQIKLVFPAQPETENKSSLDLGKSKVTREDKKNGTILTASATAGNKAKVLTGLFTRFGQSFEGKRLICQEEQFYFYPDGRVYHGLPPEGPAHLDWSKALKDTPNLCGSYGIIGDTIIFQWTGSAQPVTWKLRRKGNNLELNGMVADKAPTFSNSAKLDGTYSRPEIIVFQGKPVTTPVIYSFTADGKVSIEKKDKTLAVHRQSGSYLISGNDLELNLGSDHTTSTIFPQHLDNRSLKSPDRLSINGKLFEKVQ